MSSYVHGKSGWVMSIGLYALCILALSPLLYPHIAFGQGIPTKQKHHAKKIVPRANHTAHGTIYFIPIDIETYAAVSPDTIKRSADKVISLDADDLAIFYRIVSETDGRGIYDAATFYSLISEKKKTGTFDATHTRLRLDAGNELPLFIDNQGIVLCNHTEYSLTPSVFVRLDHFIAGLSKSK